MRHGKSTTMLRLLATNDDDDASDDDFTVRGDRSYDTDSVNIGITLFTRRHQGDYINLRGISHPSPPSPPSGLIVFRVRALPHMLAEHQNVDNIPRLFLPLGRWAIEAYFSALATKGETRPCIQ